MVYYSTVADILSYTSLFFFSFIFKEESVPDGHVTKLRLRLLSLQDCQFGRYSCHAENSFGDDFDTVLVYGKYGN